ncbi:phosphate ABC transporter substrate-binding protein PstS family protein [Aquibacillus salsiterrae]|uniref:Phosphate-binding protein n=1 Tax=Aquibacillus salsiterrae TaxID=2950439 RepID=A0A9X3WCN4_9BACI|nr:phosphate ABC transporter substrate-binding protein PstS family protein [Aquibacillus salsiterrae]MDC3415530.1 phosphate ABC transporter substrate-binding protein PstS family protein [Aquibacillus salsiterrae]
MKKIVTFLLIVLTIGLVTACGANNQEGGGDNGGNNTVLISGSSAMQPLVAGAAEEFMAQNPDADIQVNAGGSGTGLSEVDSGAVDIGNSDVFAEEKEGIAAEELVDHKVAVVGMTAAVSSNIGITDISKQDLIKVFTGEITNWSELGGKDQEITLVNRPDSSGTRATFVQFGLDGATPAEGITEDSSNRVKQIIEETPGTIGYLAFSYFTDDGAVIPLAIDGVEATDENVISGEFPIWAYEHSYTKGEPTGAVKDFLDFLLSDDIQKGLLIEQGYIPATDMKVERDAEGNQTNL